MMNINGYDFLKSDHLPGEKESCLAVKNGVLYRVARCNPSMSEARANRLCKFWDDVLQPESNIVRPLLFPIDGIWYDATEYRTQFCDEIPEIYFRCFPEPLKMHIILTALAAVAVLARNGAVHGALSPEQFRLSVTEDGFAYSVLIGGLANIGFDKAFPPLSSGDFPIQPPEAASRGLSQASDVFAMGVCAHVWLCGEYPRISAEGTADQEIFISSAISEGNREILSGMLALQPDNRPSVMEALKAFHDAKALSDGKNIQVYYSSEPNETENKLLRAALLPKSEAFRERYLKQEAWQG